MLKHTHNAEASFNFSLVQDPDLENVEITDGKIRHISEHATELESIKDDPNDTTASGIIIKRPESLDDASAMIGGLYECIIRIS